MRLTEYDRQTMINAMINVLLDLRIMALRARHNPLKLWQQLQTRMRSAARTTATAPEWGTAMLRSLQIGAPSKELSRSLLDLDRATAGKSRPWLDLVEREHGYIIAAARIEMERRRDPAQTIEPFTVTTED